MSASIQLGARRINKGIPVPYYYQIAEILRDIIADSEVSDDGQVAMPSENALCSLYSVTRATVRHALSLLEREGLIYREKGRGTFLRRRRVQLDLARLVSTTADMQARGWQPSTRVLSVAAIDPMPHVQHQLCLAEHARVWEINRLRLADGEPISLQWSYIPLQRVPDLNRQDLAGSLYYTLQNAYGVRMSTADQTVRTRIVTVEEGQCLGVPEGAPVFVIDRTSFDLEGAPIEHLHSLWRGDRYDLQVRLTAGG